MGFNKVQHANARAILESSLTRRATTWEVADAILNLQFIHEDSKLHAELKNLTKNQSWAYGQMFDDFDRVDAADTQLTTFAELFPELESDALTTARLNVNEAEYLESCFRLLSDGLSWLNVSSDVHAGEALQRRHELDWAGGEASSKKAFTKRLRFLVSFEEKLQRVADNLKLRHAQMQAKSRLAYRVDAAQMDDMSLAYAAYVAARANRRSLFMLGGQSGTFDNVSNALYKYLEAGSSWEQIAYITPMPSAFKQLDAEALGRLVGVFHSEMSVAAHALQKLWPSLPVRMRKEMVMVKGVDSSRWNAYAGALNSMRSAWIAAVQAAGLDEVFDSYLPGKAPRLMAADLVWWARATGDDLHPDTLLFAKLTRPWDVIAGTASLTRAQILKTAAALKVQDVESTGWVAPRTAVKIEVAQAEPATVHGIIVSDPSLAKVLRQVGAFSGQGLRDLNLVDSIISERTAEVDTDGKARIVAR